MRQGERLGTPLSRFLARVSRADASACWPWIGQTQNTGYGTMQWKGKLTGAHRIMAELAYGTIPPKHHVMHLCNNPICCNPAHLRVGTAAENAAMAARDGLYARPGAVLGADQVKAIRKDPRSCIVIGQQYGVSRGTIWKIKKNFAWTHV